MTSKTSSSSSHPPTVLFIHRLGSALFYGLCSGLITVVNKLVLTSYGYNFLLIENFLSHFILCYTTDFLHFNCLPLDRLVIFYAYFL